MRFRVNAKPDSFRCDSSSHKILRFCGNPAFTACRQRRRQCRKRQASQRALPSVLLILLGISGGTSTHNFITQSPFGDFWRAGIAFTFLAVLPVVAGYFLLLYAGVGLIQEKRFSGSAPKENPDAIPDRKPERFPRAHILGWTLGVLALALMVGGFVLGGWDGIRSGFGYWAFFARFVAMLYLVELYDIVFFDWILLCNSNFFAHFTRN